MDTPVTQARQVDAEVVTPSADGEGETQAAQTSTKRPVKRIRRILPLLLILSSILVMLYPVAASQWNNYRQQDFANDYNRSVSREPQATLDRLYREAEEYNAALQAGDIRDPWNETDQLDTPNYQHYASLLAIQPQMAVLRIPSIGTSLPIYHGTSSDVLAHGLGHLYGTALPVGGEGTRAAITGHTGLSTATLFDRLTEVENGDIFYIDVLGRTLKYEVKLIEVVLPNELDRLTPQPGRDLVTLITCTPYSVNSHRLLVTGERVPTVDEEDLPPDPPKINVIWQAWMTYMVVAICVGVVSGIVLGIGAGRRKRKRRNVSDKTSDTVGSQNEDADHAEGLEPVEVDDPAEPGGFDEGAQDGDEREPAEVDDRIPLAEPGGSDESDESLQAKNLDPDQHGEAKNLDPDQHGEAENLDPDQHGENDDPHNSQSGGQNADES